MLASLKWPAVFLAAVLAACAGAQYEGGNEGPALVMPHHFAEGSKQGGADQDGGSDARELIGAAERSPARGSQPDPEALRELRHYEYEITYDSGKLKIGTVRALRYATPQPTTRKMGRFAIELWIGRELIDRVRFDFPLVAAEDVRRTKKRPLEEPPSFAAGVVATQKVLVPASRRATRAVLVDRATGEKRELPWPPDAPLGPAKGEMPPPATAGDGGASVVASDAGSVVGSDAGR
jgi:hypothetical protein